MNHNRGAFPPPFCFLFEKPSSSSALAPFPLSVNDACFFSSVVSVLSLRDVSSFSSSDSEESEPERLSSRSVLSVQYRSMNFTQSSRYSWAAYLQLIFRTRHRRLDSGREVSVLGCNDGSRTSGGSSAPICLRKRGHTENRLGHRRGFRMMSRAVSRSLVRRGVRRLLRQAPRHRL